MSAPDAAARAAATVSADPAAGADDAPAPRENPYVGLVPFGEADTAWFFGRDRERRIVGANLRASRLTLVYGASGVGKSSVLLAAVVPDLRAVAAEDRAARERAPAESPEPVRFAVTVFSAWRDKPLHGLAQAVAAAVQEATGEPVEPWTPGTPLREALARWLGPVSTLLIVLDQFEEYFLYHPHDDGPGSFAAEFVEVVNDPGLRVNVLLSLREDELAKLDRFKGRIPRLFDNYLRIAHLDPAAARRAIEGPLAEYNRRLPPGMPPAAIDPELIDAVLAEVRTREVALDAPGGGPTPESSAAPTDNDRVETPLLQLVMQRLWATAAAERTPPHLRLATLRDDLGGTEKIVLRHLEEALDALPDEDRGPAVDVLRPLVSPTGTKIAWRAADIAYFSKRPAPEVESVLRELSRGQRRILRAVMPPSSEPDQAPRYEIFHDILAEPILEWCAAREAEREHERIERQREASLRERDEQARQRRRDRRSRVVRRVALGLGALTIGLVAAVAVAVNNSDVASSRGLAASAMAQLPIDPESSVLLAIEALQERRTGEAEQALRRALTASRVRATLGTGAPRPCRACSGLVTQARAAPVAPGRVAVAPDGRHVAGVVAGRLRLWAPLSGETFRPGISVGGVERVAFTPDARRLLVVGSDRAALMAPDGSRASALPGMYSEGATSPDSRHVVTVGADGAAVWDARSGRPIAERTDDEYLSAAFTDARRVELQDQYGRLSLWSWRTQRTRPLAPRGELRHFTRFARGGRFAVDGAGGGKVRVVSRNGATAVLPPGTQTEPVGDVTISPDGSRVATVHEATVELWGSRRPWRAPARRIATFSHTDGVTAVTFSPDSRLVGTASTDGTGRVWEAATGDLVAELRGHAAGVESLAFGSSGRYVATLGEDLSIRLWDLGAERTLRGAREVLGIAAARSVSQVAIAEDGGGLRLWDTHDRRAPALEPRELVKKAAPTRHRRIAPTRGGRAGAVGRTPDMHPTSLAFTGDDRSLLVGYMTPDRSTGRAELLAAATGVVRARIDNSGAVLKVAVDRAGRVAAIVNETDAGMGVAVWRLREGGASRPWHVPLAERQRSTNVAFSPDGRQLLVTSVFGSARLFDIRTRKLLRVLASGSAARPGPEAFYAAAFSPDGETIAVAGSRDVRLWDVASGSERLPRLSGHTSVLGSVAYSADGRRVLTASSDGTTRVWDAKTGAMLSVLSRHAGRVNHAAFLSDGSIVSGGEDRTVRVYRCETCGPVKELLRRARRQVTRDLTKGERNAFVK